MSQVYFTKTQRTLTTVARNMRADVNRVAWTRRVLSGGLELLLERSERNQYRLACARETTQPSDLELTLVRKAFSLPESIQWQRRQANRKKVLPDGTQRIFLNPLHIAECTWHEE